MFENEEGEDSDEEDDDSEIMGVTKPREKKKKGRKSQWSDACIEDLVDIILEDDKLKEKLLFTNVKNVKNGQYYAEVRKEIETRCVNRGEGFKYNVNQCRSKFKRCQSLCRKALLFIKTKSGIKRFQDKRATETGFLN